MQLTRGQVAIIDPEDWEMVSRFPWWASRVKKASFPWYALTTIGRHSIPLHMLLTRFPETDHINGNGLDNRRINLRQAQHGLNIANQEKRRPLSTSRFKGVGWDKSRDRWMAKIMVNQKNIFLGRFTDEIEAAKAYDVAAIKHFGEFARTNRQIGLLPEETRDR